MDSNLYLPKVLSISPKKKMICSAVRRCQSSLISRSRFSDGPGGGDLITGFRALGTVANLGRHSDDALTSQISACCSISHRKVFEISQETKY